MSARDLLPLIGVTRLPADIGAEGTVIVSNGDGTSEWGANTPAGMLLGTANEVSVTGDAGVFTVGLTAETIIPGTLAVQELYQFPADAPTTGQVLTSTDGATLGWADAGESVTVTSGNNITVTGAPEYKVALDESVTISGTLEAQTSVIAPLISVGNPGVSITFSLPATSGTAGQILTSAGAGAAATWVTGSDTTTVAASGTNIVVAEPTAGDYTVALANNVQISGTFAAETSITSALINVGNPGVAPAYTLPSISGANGAIMTSAGVDGVTWSENVAVTGSISAETSITCALINVGNPGEAPSYTFPGIIGTAGHVLTTNGVDTVSWAAPATPSTVASADANIDVAEPTTGNYTVGLASSTSISGTASAGEVIAPQLTVGTLATSIYTLPTGVPPSIGAYPASVSTADGQTLVWAAAPSSSTSVLGTNAQLSIAGVDAVDPTELFLFQTGKFSSGVITFPESPTAGLFPVTAVEYQVITFKLVDAMNEDYMPAFSTAVPISLIMYEAGTTTIRGYAISAQLVPISPGVASLIIQMNQELFAAFNPAIYDITQTPTKIQIAFGPWLTGPLGS